MIYTLTLNPSIDYIMHVDDIVSGGTNYTHKEYMLPGGKGINVSRVLKQLNVPNKALGFIGGRTGQFIEDWLCDEGATFDFIEVQGNTRINVKLKGAQETEINGRGPQITDQEIAQLKTQISLLTSADTLILSGSKNRGLSDNFYLELLSICLANGVSFVIDTNSKELLEALKFKPLLIKPNQAELGDLFQVTIQSTADAIYYGQKLQALGAQYVIVSLGGDGAIFLDGQEVYQADAPHGQVINTVGSGDSMIAGFIAGLVKSFSPVEAFELAVQSGSATAFNEDLARKNDILALNELVKIKKL